MGRQSRIRRMLSVSIATLAAAAGFSAGDARAADPFTIPVILPLTGSASFLGKGQNKVLDALADDVNQKGGVQGRQIKFSYRDDQTSPQLAVELTNTALAPHPPVVLGSSLVGMCLAMAPLMKNGPVQYCLSPAIHPQPGGFVFSSSSSSIDQIAAVVRYYRMKGWTRIAVLDASDASGQDGDRAIDAVLAYPENKGKVAKVATEHFNPTDVSVTAQIEKIKSSGAQAIIAWTTGGPVATVFRGMAQAGLDLPVAPSSGNQTFEAMKAWKSFLPKQLILASALYPPHDGLLQLDPPIEKAQKEMYEELARRNVRPDNQVATSWDAGLIVLSAFRKLGFDATSAQIRDYIANLSDFAGVDGVYDFKKYPERGLGPASSTVTTYDGAKDSWVWLSKPGGEPLN